MIAPVLPSDLSAPLGDLLPREKLWTFDELLKAYSLGTFAPDERYELIEGRLYKKMGQNNPHYVTVKLVERALEAVYSTGYTVFAQAPINVSPSSRPEPDAMVVPGDIREYEGVEPLPEQVILAVEVSDSSLREDTGDKAALYARMELRELWIVDIKGRRVEVRRRSSSDGLWKEIIQFRPGESIPAPGVDAHISIDDLLMRPVNPV